MGVMGVDLGTYHHMHHMHTRRLIISADHCELKRAPVCNTLLFGGQRGGNSDGATPAPAPAEQPPLVQHRPIVSKRVAGHQAFREKLLSHATRLPLNPTVLTEVVLVLLGGGGERVRTRL